MSSKPPELVLAEPTSDIMLWRAVILGLVQTYAHTQMLSGSECIYSWHWHTSPLPLPSDKRNSFIFRVNQHANLPNVLQASVNAIRRRHV